MAPIIFTDDYISRPDWRWFDHRSGEAHRREGVGLTLRSKHPLRAYAGKKSSVAWLRGWPVSANEVICACWPVFPQQAGYRSNVIERH